MGTQLATVTPAITRRRNLEEAPVVHIVVVPAESAGTARRIVGGRS
jgi:hypothetical protein